MNTPREWESDIDEQFGHLNVDYDFFLEEIKSFIRTIEDKAREEERERVRKLVEVEKYDEDEEDLGAEAIADHAYKDKFEAFRYGYNQALSDIIKALNEKKYDLEPPCN